MPNIDQDQALPKTLYIETTNRCNLKCRGCILYRGNPEPERTISLQQLSMITDQLPDLERAVLHGVGEPLLNPELAKMIRHLKKRKVYVLFNSNGILLDAGRRGALIDAGLDELRISLDAASAEGYQKMRDSAYFNHIIDNLHAFVQELHDRQAAGPRLSLWFLGTRDNITELSDLVRLAAHIGICEVYLQRLVYFQDDTGYGVARPEKTLRYADTAMESIENSRDIALELGVQLNASGLCDPMKSLRGQPDALYPWSKCYRPETLMYITATGNVLPCCIAPFATTDFSALILGNVFESSVKKIWCGAGYENFRKRLKTETPPKCCRGCGILWSL